jgi:hypothetical protein
MSGAPDAYSEYIMLSMMLPAHGVAARTIKSLRLEISVIPKYVRGGNQNVAFENSLAIFQIYPQKWSCQYRMAVV